MTDYLRLPIVDLFDEDFLSRQKVAKIKEKELPTL